MSPGCPENCDSCQDTYYVDVPEFDCAPPLGDCAAGTRQLTRQSGCVWTLADATCGAVITCGGGYWRLLIKCPGGTGCTYRHAAEGSGDCPGDGTYTRIGGSCCAGEEDCPESLYVGKTAPER